MSEDIDNLIAVQTIDLEITALRQSKKDMPKQCEELKKEITLAETAAEGIRKKIADAEADKKTAEFEVVKSKDALAKSQERLNTIQTNKEYDAVHSEIDTHTKKIKSAEDRILALMEEVGNLQKEVETAETAHKEVLEKNQPEIARIEAEISQIDDKVKEAQKHRNEAVKTVKPRTLSVYERILKGRKTGLVLSFVLPDHRSCAFCNKKLTLQQVNEVRRNKDIIVCDSCSSILVWKEKEPANG